MVKNKSNKKIEDIKKKIVKTLKRNKVTRAGIFGSYVRGEEKKDSDVDILVEINDPELSLLGFIALKHRIEDILGKSIDLVEYGAIKPRIKKRILTEEIRII